jgi:hypothetical protein
MVTRTAICWRCRRPLFYDPAIGEICVNRECDAPQDMAPPSGNSLPPIFRAIGRTSQSIYPVVPHLAGRHTAAAPP